MIIKGGLLYRENIHCKFKNKSLWKKLNLHYRKIGLVTNESLILYKLPAVVRLVKSRVLICPGRVTQETINTEFGIKISYKLSTWKNKRIILRCILGELGVSEGAEGTA